MKILDRYILRELAGPFLFGVGVFSILLAAGFILPKLTDLFTESRLSVSDGFLLFLYLLPRYLVLTFAMSTLLAVLLAFGRLSAESEMVAFHAAGASLPRLTAPGIVFGVAISLLALLLGEAIVPQANHAADRILDRAKGQISGVEKNVVFFEKDRQGTERTIYAALFDPAAGVMEQVTINELRNSQPVAGIYAKKARRTGNLWELFDGYSYTIRGGLPITSVVFREETIDYLGSPEAIASRSKKRPIEMSYRELKAHIGVLRNQGKEASDYEVELPRRFSLPFASLVFALIGTPLGMRSHRRSSSIGLGFTVLIVFAYYIVWNWLAIVAKNGALAPGAAAWLPNIVFALAGLTLIFTARK